MKNKKPSAGELIKGLLVWVVIAVIAYNYFSEDIPPHIEYGEKTLKSIKESSIADSTIQSIAKSYANENNLLHEEEYLYTCLGDIIYDKDESFTVNKMIGWCIDEINNKTKKTHYNTSALLADFSSWDGSYRPIEDIIKKNMNDPSSYEHVKTLYRFVYYGVKRPHMIVETTFRGKNAFGGIVLDKVSANVDAKTKEIYEIQMD